MTSASRHPVLVARTSQAFSRRFTHPALRVEHGRPTLSRCWSMLAASLVLLTSFACAERTIAPLPPNASIVSAPDAYVGSYIVRLAPSVADVPGRARDLVQELAGRQGRVWSRRVRGFSVHNIGPVAAEQLRHREGVLSVEPLRRFRVNGTQSLPNDGAGPQYGKLWALDRIDKSGGYGYDTTFTYANTGDDVHIYIIDTGVRGGHTEFSGRIGAGTCIVSYYILGVFQYHVSCSETIDPVGHGTAVASAAAGTTYGVAKDAIIHPVRVANSGGDIAEDDVIDALEWVAANATFPAVVNISLGKADSADAGSFAVRDAIDDVLDQGILVFKSAGNFGEDAWNDRSNRASRSVITGAIGWNDTRSSFSNSGSTVGMMAPGAAMFLANSGADSDTSTWYGTSFASPLAAGVAATLLQGYPGMSVIDLKNWLVANSSAVTITNGNSVANLVLFSNMSMPSPPPPSLSVTILGSSTVPPSTPSCFFSSTVSGGSGGYNYVWKKDGSTVGSNSPDLSISTGGADFVLELTVSATGYSSGFDSRSIVVSGGAPSGACDVF